MATETRRARARFDPSAFESFRFTARELDDRGRVTLRYALDEEIAFTEAFRLPLGDPARRLDEGERERVDGLLALLHWVAGVSYYKTALPPQVSCETGTPPPAVAALLEALYSDGLAELAYTNDLAALPRPSFAGGASSPRAVTAAGTTAQPPDTAQRILVPVGGGKDSAVAVEIVRRSGHELALFSLGDAPPIARTVAAAGLPRLLATRALDPGLPALNAAGALNGHVPITAIVSCVALLSAALNGFDAVAMANERSASAGNVMWDGVEVNHQFSKGLRAERLLSAALAEAAPDVRAVLGPAPRLGAGDRARVRAHGALPRCVHELQRDLPHRPGAARGFVVLRLPQVPFRVPGARAVHARPQQLREIFGSRPARRRAPVRGLCAADRDGRAQAVRVRGRGAGEPRGDPPARARRALESPRRGAAAGGRGPAAVPCRRG